MPLSWSSFTAHFSSSIIWVRLLPHFSSSLGHLKLLTVLYYSTLLDPDAHYTTSLRCPQNMGVRRIAQRLWHVLWISACCMTSVTHLLNQNTRSTTSSSKCWHSLLEVCGTARLLNPNVRCTTSLTILRDADVRCKTSVSVFWIRRVVARHLWHVFWMQTFAARRHYRASLDQSHPAVPSPASFCSEGVHMCFMVDLLSTNSQWCASQLPTLSDMSFRLNGKFAASSCSRGQIQH